MRLAGEPDDIERVTSGSEGGGWKSAGVLWTHGNSLAAYPAENPILITGEGCEALSRFPLAIEEI